MINNSVIIPNVIPGWHFGDTLAGKWSNNSGGFFLTMENNGATVPFRYRILKLERDSLLLEENGYPDDLHPGKSVPGDFRSGMEIIFITDKTF